ncbi:hypothetical protein K438DRAFT_1927030 [Mycena galopus ATCC 62051]|nr:hypothetical protein K438DRAFT_1927030 [Mycena galopus ATCC 62051]
MPRQSTVAKAQLSDITACLKLTLPLLHELNDAIGPPFVQSIANTVQTLINSIQNVKRNKSECVQLIDNIHHILYAIINLHLKSETLGALPLSMLSEIGKFMETLHKISTFIELRQEGRKIKHLFQTNEMNKLLQDCHTGLKQAQGAFGAQTLNNIQDFKETANIMHKELIELVDKLSDTSTVSERSSVYQGNGMKNSSNSFSMLPSKPKIFHGRESELNHILRLLTEQSPRIAILGGGGMGKTSLAKVVLHHPDTSSNFEHRFFISAEAATTSVELAALIGLHVGLNPGKDLTKPVVQYFSRKRSCILVLDNLEAVWEPMQSRTGVEELLCLLSELEHLALIITMRGAERPAKVRWTHPFLLPLQPLSDDAARQTFIEITDNSHTQVEMDQLLGFTDNMPLAVDLIAHLADYEGFANVFSRWKTEKTSLLSIGSDRRSSVDASISLSLSSPRITSECKELLSLLSILPNGLSEAELVQGNLGIPNILSCKAVLQATSLTYRDRNQRLMVLMPIREYIQQILPPSLSGLQAICKHFHALLELFTKYHGEQLQPVVNQIVLNLANLQEILQWELHSDATTLADTINCILYVNRFYRLTGRSHFPLLDNIHLPLSQLCDHQLETRFLTELLLTLHYWKNVSEEMIAKAIIYFDHANNHVLSAKCYLAAADYFDHCKCDSQRATQLRDQALEISEQCGDLNQQCHVLIQIGWHKWRIGDYSAGNTYAIAAQRLSKLSANLYLEAYARNYRTSAAQLQRGTDLLYICGMSGGLIAHNITLAQAEIHASKSEHMEARNIFCQIVETTSAEKNSVAYANALVNIGLIDTIIGGAEEDICRNLETATNIFQKDSMYGIAVCDILQAIIDFRGGKFEKAKVKLRECLHSNWGTYNEGACLCLEHLANIKAWPTNVLDKKSAIIYLAYAHRSQMKLDLHKALLFLGDVFVLNNDEETATNLYQVALAGFTHMDIHQGRAQCMLRLGDIANKHGHTSESVTFWKAARQLFAQSSLLKDVAQIDSKLATLENTQQGKALVKPQTFHAPVQPVNKETSEIEAKDSADEDAEEDTVRIRV